MNLPGAAVPAVELRGLSKRFGAVAANHHIDLKAYAGSIHAVIGENGAGKSTAMKLLYGMYAPDSGEILIRGELKRWATTAQAIANGIGMVHQHFMLAEPYSALENVILGAEPLELEFEGFTAGRKLPLPRWAHPINRKSARIRLNQLSEQYGLKGIRWEDRIEDLSVGVQQRIEILKLLYRNASILILDEPTAVLTPQETSELFVNLRRLAAEGKTILIITHKLKEVMEIADDITVFRAGQVVGQTTKAKTNPEELASMMVGRKVSLTATPPPEPKVGSPVLDVQGLSLGSVSMSGLHRLCGVSFSVRAGEVVGIAGIEGNGQSELLQILQHPRDYRSHCGGSVRLMGTEVLASKNACTAREVKAMGVGVIPEDRHKEGLLLERPVLENFLLGQQRRDVFKKAGFILYRKLKEAAANALKRYDVRPPNLKLASSALSGGNQQKLIVAREFEREPVFLIAAQPTRGVDVGAIEAIHGRILEARTAGAGVLLVSSELDEILALSDRILVIYGGRIVAEFPRGGADEQTIGMHMAGASSDVKPGGAAT
ncbi:MAG: heme ABC transporter ATP-binding protein [Bdellovibrionales bacterium GWB1_55_8]|nr:MAG: heme ABC transporter ATP-binding protein [Bdellovibrionales bacterium GWB1_55_8]